MKSGPASRRRISRQPATVLACIAAPLYLFKEVCGTDSPIYLVEYDRVGANGEEFVDDLADIDPYCTFISQAQPLIT